jgi:hypothetical protein
MGDKTIVNDGASVTEFDAENLQTDKEKRRDGMSEEDIRKGDWGIKPAPVDSSGAPRKAQDAVQDRKTRNRR